jgi:hypothetical protein
MLSSATYAACAPDPTVIGGTTLCTATDSDGIAVTTGPTTVRVAAGAVVGGSTARPLSSAAADSRLIIEGNVDGRGMAPAGPAVLLSGALPRIDIVPGGAVLGADTAIRYAPVTSSRLTIDNAGRIEATGTAIQLQTSPVASLDLVSRAGSIIRGATAIGVFVPSGSFFGSPFINTFDNAGTISGVAGRAVDLTGTNVSPGSIATFINRAGGVIQGEIAAGSLSQFSNAGTIDGGARSALNLSSQSFSTWINSGTITSGRTDGSTIAGTSYNIDNSGTISNTGGNAAIAPSFFGSIRNLAGGTVSSTGATAVRFQNGSSTLDNGGRIIGDVEFGTSFGDDRVVQRGIVQGSVRLGAGVDTFLVDLDTVATGTGVTGTLDAGTGDDAFGYTTAAVRQVALAAPPVTFERLLLDTTTTEAVLTATGTIGGATLTTQGLGTVITSFDVTRTSESLLLAGAATTINRGTLDFTGANQTFQRSAAIGGGGRVVNEGTIVARGAKSLVTQSPSNFDNRGTIRVLDGAGFADNGNITNSGTIELAAATSRLLTREINPFGSSSVDNRGTITAVGSVIVDAASNTFSTILNSGTIRAGARAIDLSARTSTFSSSTITNRSTGVIDGTMGAIIGSVGSESVVNEGRIVGLVDLGDGNDSFFSTGRLEGDLRLGGGNDIFTINAAMPGVVTGTIDAGAGIDTRRLFARSDAVVDFAADTRFEVTDLVVNGANSPLGIRPAVLNRTALSAAAGATAATVTGNVAFTNAAALAADGAGATALRTGAINAGQPTVNNDGAITLANGATGLSVASALVVNRGVITGTGMGVVAGSGRIDNAGRIATTGTAIQLSSARANNSGTLESSTGAAVVSVSGTTTFTNLATGVLRGGAGLAYLGSLSGETVANAGRIVGDVSLGGGNDTYRFDGGMIEGRLLLGSGNDRVDVGLRGLDVVLASGGVDAGEGDDVYAFSIDSSRSLDLVKVTGFDGIGITTIGTGTMVTLTAGAALDALLEVGGDGTVVNDRALARTGGNVVRVASGSRFTNRAAIDVTGAATGTAITGIDSVFAQVVNEGALRAIGATASGLRSTNSSFLLGDTANVLNRGTVAATGGASGIVLTGGVVRNSGTVTADGQSTGLTVFDGGRLINDGTISGAGAGVSFAQTVFGGSERRFINNGTVEVAGIAARIIGTAQVVNNARLASTGGAALDIGSEGSFGTLMLANESGGVITGATTAISAHQNAAVRIANRGTITGNINLASATGNVVGSGDIFFADGGRVTGDLRFGASDDMFIVGLAQAAAPGASISGVLDMGAGTDTLRLRTTTSASATVLTTATGFERVGYEAEGRDTLLRLTSATPLSRLELSGNGSIDLTSDFQSTGTALVLNSSSTAELFADPFVSRTAAQAPRVVSRGNIVSAAPTNFSGEAAITLSNAERFENAGTIRLTQAANTFISRAAISGSGVVVNSGRIEISNLNNGISGSGTLAVVNSGTIEQTEGSTGSALVNIRSFENSGTLRSAGAAVNAFAGRGINSGTIESTGTVAIAGAVFVVNETAGRIIGRPGSDAISALGNNSGGGLVNAGFVRGNVTFGSGSDLFIAAGGTVEGSVSLGAGDDSFLVRGTAPLPTGGVTSGAGRDAFGRSFTASATYALEKPAEYEMFAVEAAGAATTVTVTSATTAMGGLRVFGTGTVINRANIGLTGEFDPALVTPAAAVELRRVGDSLDDSSLRFVNQASITSTGVGVRTSGDAHVGAGFAGFENSGTIDSRFAAASLSVAARSTSVSIVNSGTLRSTEAVSAFVLGASRGGGDASSTTLAGVEFNNSGTIANANAAGSSVAVEIETERASVTFVNSGTIETASAIDGTALELSATRTTFTNSGRILATGRGSDAVSVGLSREDVNASVPAFADSLITNDGTIRTSGNGGYVGLSGSFAELLSPSVALAVVSDTAVAIRNGSAGVIEATGDRSAGIFFGSVALSPPRLTLTNAGTIRGGGATLGDTETYLLPGGIGIGTDRVLAGALVSVGATDTITNAATGRMIGGVDLGAGDDSLENLGRIEGAVRLGTGNDRFLQALSGALVGSVDGGEGTDALVFDITGGGTIDFRQFSNFEAISQRGRGAVIFAGLDGGPLPIETFDVVDSGFTLAAGQTFATRGTTTLTGSAGTETVTNAGTIGGTVDLGGGNDSVVNSGRIGGSVLLGAGDDTVINSGSIGGSVLLDSGSDRYTTNGVATAGGPVDGGDGIDVLEFAVAGTAAAPTAWTGVGTTGFETLQLSQGTLSLTGSTPAFVTTTVAAGALVGQAGSVLTSQIVNVAQVAVFGSSGRVIGNVAVGGTLSPGASPGTMTVTGNVALAPTSTTLFEFTPTAVDQLLVSGTTSIAAGATLTLTGTRAGSAVPLDLIVSEGGLTGNFPTLNKAAGVIGFLAQRGNRLQLIGQFANDTSFSAPARAAIDYINTALSAAQVSPALATALPSLLTGQGGAAADRFAELTPEAYATAMSYSASRSLLLADSVRSAARGAGEATGAFILAAAVSEWSDAKGGPASEAEFKTRGMIGGVGYHFEGGARIAAFVGTLGGDARTDVLRARTDVDGVVFGVHSRAVLGAVDFDATVAYDAGNGNLTRTLGATGTSLNARFDLTGWLADVSASTRVVLSPGWALTPRVGITHVGIDREAAGETGSVFALATSKGSNNRLFGTAALEIEGVAGNLRPFVGLALQQRIDGREAVASGQLAGISGSALTAAGADLGTQVFALSGGLRADLSSRIRLTGRYEAKAGDRKGHNVSVGLSAAF